MELPLPFMAIRSIYPPSLASAPRPVRVMQTLPLFLPSVSSFVNASPECYPTSGIPGCKCGSTVGSRRALGSIRWSTLEWRTFFGPFLFTVKINFHSPSADSFLHSIVNMVEWQSPAEIVHDGGVSLLSTRLSFVAR